jgi:GNAT superfamily N-acetyltransferase
MSLRRGSAQDAEAVGRVHAVSRAAAYAHLVPAQALAEVTPQTQARYWRRRLHTELHPHAMYVAEVDGTVQGFAMGSAPGTTATLHALHVVPEVQGTGTGRLLHDAVLHEFEAWGCTAAELWVLDGNERAQEFYRRHGWLPDGGRDSHEIGGVTVSILRYRRDISAARR